MLPEPHIRNDMAASNNSITRGYRNSLTVGDMPTDRELVMNRRCRIAGIAASIVASSAAWPGVALGQIAARTELHRIETLTITDQQFLKGETAGTTVAISGQLRIPRGSGRLPLVVLQHGSSGYAANIDVWSRTLNEMGISTLALDAFTGRGLTEVNSNQGLLGRLNFILDIYRALGVVASHPRVDRERIALMGFSRGGQAALYASLKRFNATWNKSGVELAAYVAFYPDCMTAFIADTEVSDRPIRIFAGALDDYNPISKCKAYVERLRAAGRDVQLIEYPGAHHAFDNPFGPQPAAASPAFQSVRNCNIREEAGGVLVNSDTKQPFTYRDACVVRGPHLGHDPAASEAAASSVRALFKAVFKLD
jgi:dienelactone hydrolase